MKYFLIDNNQVFSYDDLIADINSSKTYFPLYRTNDLYLYFLNLIISLIHNKSLVLIDSDSSSDSISNTSGIDQNSVNKPVYMPDIETLTISEILKRIHNSTSEISIFTSGTTGQPKKVDHTVVSLTRNVKVLERFSNNIWGFTFSPTHMAGLQVFFQAFLNNNTIVNLYNSSRTQVNEAIQGHSISHISATPTFYRLLLPFEVPFLNVQSVSIGGEKSDYKLHEAIRNLFPNAKINNIYASTEAGSLFASNGEIFQIPVLISHKIKVIDDELMIHKTLLGKSDSFNLVDDFYCTGDLIEWVNKEKSLFRFKSRKNELINVGGYKVNPTEIETAILEIPQVHQAIVYGKKNSVLGNLLCADVKLIPFAQLDELEIKKYLSEYLQDYKIPRIITIVESISVTKTGKLKRI